MKAAEIAALLNEPTCVHCKKDKSGCAKPESGATAGCGSFGGAQIALLPIADVAHMVHGPIACAGSSWDNRATRSSGPTLYCVGITTDLTEPDVIMGRGEKRLFHAIKQAIDSCRPVGLRVACDLARQHIDAENTMVRRLRDRMEHGILAKVKNTSRQWQHALPTAQHRQHRVRMR